MQRRPDTPNRYLRLIFICFRSIPTQHAHFSVLHVVSSLNQIICCKKVKASRRVRRCVPNCLFRGAECGAFFLGYLLTLSAVRLSRHTALETLKSLNFDSVDYA